MTKFKVGSVYRNGHGCVVRVVREEEGMLKAAFADGSFEFSFDFDPITGEYFLWPGKKSSEPGLYLLPGELHQVNGEWVPLGISEEGPKPEEREAWERMFSGAIGAGRPVLQAAPEPQRPALDWNKPTTVDRFPGFTVKRYDADDLMPPAPERSSPLQRMSQEGDQMHGSAWLRKG